MHESSRAASIGQLLRYGLLAITIAFGGLPIYIHLPKLYADEYHINFTTLGLILMILRIVDAFTDPILGPLSDKLQKYRQPILWLGACLLTLAFNALFYAPTTFIPPVVWFTIITFLVYLGYSTLVINYYAVGLLLASDYQQRTRVSAFRETLSLLGIIIASVLPEILMEHHPRMIAFRYYGLIFIAIALMTCFYLPKVPSMPTQSQDSTSSPLNFRSVMHVVANNNPLKWIFVLVFLNNLPTAFTSNLFLFYISDVLKRPHQAGYYLITYFLAAACSSIMWLAVAKKWGKRQTLLCGIILSIISGLLTYNLPPHMGHLFYFICILSGLALGSDSIILPALFADIIDDHKTMGGSFFSIWQALIKLTLALGAGTALPFLSFIGYVPGSVPSDATTSHISLVYTLLPCCVKCIVFIAIVISPIDTKHRLT